MKALAELHKKQREGSVISDILLYFPFIDKITKTISKQKKKVLEVENQVEQKRQELVEATKKKKTLEKLIENALRAHMKEVQKGEQDFLNEVGINSFFRRDVGTYRN